MLSTSSLPVGDISLEHTKRCSRKGNAGQERWRMCDSHGYSFIGRLNKDTGSTCHKPVYTHHACFLVPFLYDGPPLTQHGIGILGAIGG